MWEPSCVVLCRRCLRRFVTRSERWLGSAKPALWVELLLCLCFGIAWEFLLIGHLSQRTKWASWCIHVRTHWYHPGYALPYSLSVIFLPWFCRRESCSWLLEERKNLEAAHHYKCDTHLKGWVRYLLRQQKQNLLFWKHQLAECDVAPFSCALFHLSSHSTTLKMMESGAIAKSCVLSWV